jgi:hypothetical protein
MAGLADILLNAASGGVVGSVLHLGTGIFETWRKKKDAEVEIMLLNAKVQAAEKEAAWNAFAKSQEAGSSAPFVVPSGVPPWAATVATLVESFRSFTRPGLTWALLLVLVYVFAVSPEADRSQMLGEITFGAFTSLFWWFGSRYSKGSK